jgi:hypothetical protein
MSLHEKALKEEDRKAYSVLVWGNLVDTTT